MIGCDRGIRIDILRHLAVPLAIVLVIAGTAPATIFDDDWKPPARQTPPPQTLPPAKQDTSSEPGSHPTTQGTSGTPAAAAPATAPAVPSAKARVPAEQERARSRKVLKEVFADKLADTSPPARRQLAVALLDQVGPSQASPTDQYVLLTAAIDSAEQGRSLDLAFRAVDLLALRFDVDALAAKNAAAIKVMSAPDPWVDDGTNAQDAMDLESQLVQESDFADARRLLSAARSHAERTNDSDLSARVQAAMTTVDAAQRGWQSFKAGLARLHGSPEDPEANYAVGAYACFVQGQWDRGLPYLTLGSNPAVRSAAKAERSLAPADGADAMVKVANAWWEIASQQPAHYRQGVIRHAADLYRRAVPRLSGLELGFAQKRIELAAQDAARAPGAKSWYSVPAIASWTATDFTVTAGNCYEIVANGTWRGSRGAECGPAGLCPDKYFAVLGHQPALSDEQKEEYYVGQHPRSALIARIGDEPWTFFVGGGCRFVAPVGGKLSFKMNDTDQPSGDRAGRIQLAITPIRPRWVNPDGTVEILARIDDTDTFHITPQGVFWVYGGSAGRVGLHDGYYPTVINGIDWWPKWPNKDRTDVFPLTDLWPRSLSQFRLAKVEAKRGHVKVLAVTRAEIIIQFHDDGLGSSQVGCVIYVGRPPSPQ